MDEWRGARVLFIVLGAERLVVNMVQDHYGYRQIGVAMAVLWKLYQWYSL